MSNIYQIIESLRETSSRNDKKYILLKHKNNDLLKRYLYLTYNQYICSKIKTIEYDYLKDQEGDKDIVDVFDEFESMYKSGSLTKDYIYELLNECNFETRELLIDCAMKNIRAGVKEKTLLECFGNDFIPIFAIQLANTYDKSKRYNVNHWYYSAKLNGLRCIFKNNLYTRKGHYIKGFEHLESICQDICTKYDLEFIDGELYSDKIPFEMIQSYVMGLKKIAPTHKQQIKYCLFSCHNKNIKNTAEMIDILNSINNDLSSNPYILILNQEKIQNDPNIIEEKTKELTDQNFEGIVLRHPIVHYSFNRDDYLLKYKLFKEHEFKIIGFIPGKGKYEDTLGAILIEGYIDNKKITCKVGSGFTDDLRNEIWLNQNIYLNKEITVKYQELTMRDNSLRNPVIIKIDR
jgi:DNA ligase-1